MSERDAKRRLLTLEQLLAIRAPEVASTLLQAADLLAATMHAEKVDIFLPDAPLQNLVVLGGSAPSNVQPGRSFGLERLSLTSGGQVVNVYHSGRPYQNGRVEQDPKILAGFRLTPHLWSLIAVPIMVGDEILGVLVAASGREEAYGPDDLAFLVAAGHWIGVLQQHADLSQRITRDAAEQVRRTTAEELVTTLAHDLGNYMTPLYGRLELLLAHAKNDGRADDAELASAALRRMERMRAMIHGLLDAARLEHGIFTLLPQTFDLVRLVREIAELQNTGDHAIEVQGVEALIVRADPERVRQVLENLLANARHYSPPKAPIVVHVYRERQGEHEQAVITVQDTGPGIMPNLLARIFDRFVVGSHSEGMGLGLYLAHGIAEAHGGSLTVESIRGVGTVFKFVLPTPPIDC